MFDQIAYAMGAPGQGGQTGFGMFIPLILLFAIFYFLLIRPQQKRQREHRELLTHLRKGDQVITTGGLYGRITGLTDTVVTLEITEKVRVKVARNQISTKLLSQPDRSK
ncbi:MAG: preprotein translocase subunit YajC [Syntrophobacterales bacterium]|nr:MAG: preprotein translocase subunit YajC [Syntrophobacterales bacterium]